MPKSKDAFRTISEVAEWLGIQAHVLRFWESKFTQVKPIKRAGGRRYYRPADMLLLGGIKKLLHDDGLTIKGVQKILREAGMNHVASLSAPLDDAGSAQSEEGRATEEAKGLGLTAPDAEEKGVVLPFGAPLPAETAQDDAGDSTEADAAAPADLAPPTAPEAPTATDLPDIPVEKSAPRVDDSADLRSDETAPVQEPSAETEETSVAPDDHLSPAEPEGGAQPDGSGEATQTAEAAQAGTEDVAEAEDTAPAEADETAAEPAADSAPTEEAEPAQAATVDDGPEETDAATDAAPDEVAPETAPAAEQAESPAASDAATDSASETPDDAEAAQAEAHPRATEPEQPQPARKPRKVTLPPFTAEQDFPALPAALTAAARLRQLTPEQAREIAPALARLTALRDAMASNRTPGVNKPAGN